MKLNIWNKQRSIVTRNSNLFENKVQAMDDSELENIYGGCNIDFSPIAPISQNIIIDKYSNVE